MQKISLPILYSFLLIDSCVSENIGLQWPKAGISILALKLFLIFGTSMPGSVATSFLEEPYSSFLFGNHFPGSYICCTFPFVLSEKII